MPEEWVEDPSQAPRAWEAYALAYEGALRSLSQQEETVDNLRARAGTLISAIAISTSFLGAQALGEGGLTGPSVFAIAFFVLAIGCCLGVLLPQRDAWGFRIDPTTWVGHIDSQPLIELVGWHRAMALEIGQTLERNDERIRWLARLVVAAIGLLLAEIVAWIIDLARG